MSEIKTLRKELVLTKIELALTERLLKERNRVMDAIPECPIHGAQCVPHALEWIEAKKQSEQPRTLQTANIV